MRTVEEAMAQPIPAGDAATGQPVTSGGDDEKKGVSFAAMFFTTFFFVVLIVGAVLGTRQYVRRKTLQRQHSLEQEKENLQNQWRDVNLHDVSMSDLNLQEYLDREYPGMNNSLQQYLDREYPVPRRFPSLTLT
jgi:cell division protein FtsL